MSLAISSRATARYWMLMAVSLLGSVGCVRSRPTEAPAPAPVQTTSETRLRDTVWYISTRAREQGRDTRRFADSLEYGIAIHTYRRSADVLVDGLDLSVSDSVLMSRGDFITGIRDATGASSETDFAVLFVHGFGTSQRECWRYASESHIRSRSRVPWVAFCWPSNGTGFAPPTLGAILDRAYRSDSSVAVESQPAFARAAAVMLEALKASQLMLVSHSLGAQLLAGALRDSTALHARLARQAARAIVFTAPDVARDRFADSVVTNLKMLTERMVIYTSSDDRMLALSRARSGAARAGERQESLPALLNIETVDATESLSAENQFAQLFGTHHALRRASGILFDMIYVVGARRSPECRVILGTGTWSADMGWALTRVRPDPHDVEARCASATRELR